MKVKNLIKILQQYDPDSNVFLLGDKKSKATGEISNYYILESDIRITRTPFYDLIKQHELPIQNGSNIVIYHGAI